jgi:cytochrome c
MLFPDQWHGIHGFLDALMLANVLPRWLHFMLASVSASGLLLAWWTSRPGFVIPGLAAADLRRQGYAIALATSGLQFIAGPLVWMTLPSVGLNLRLHLALFLGIAFALPALYWMWREIATPSALPGPGRRFWWIVASLGLTVLFMATARHLYRDEALAVHQARFAVARDAYAERSALARTGAVLPPMGRAEHSADPPIRQASPSASSPAAPADRGAEVFKLKCRACHQLDKRLVGPPLQEVARIYAGNPEGIAAWVVKPGRKRTDYPPMAPVKLPPDDLKAVAEYVLRVGGSATAAAVAPPPVRP